MSNEFPPNDNSSRRARPEKEVVPEREAIKQVTKKKVIVRKRPLYKQFFDAFRPEDNKGFFEYVVLDVLAQGVKDAIADASISSIETALGSNRRRNRRGGGGSGGYTSYNRMHSGGRSRGRRDDDDDRRGRGRRDSRRVDDHQEYIVSTRVEAEEVLDLMIELIGKYDCVTKRDLLGILGEPHTTTDEDWGWYDLRGARIHMIRDGYLVDLPRPEPLD